MKKKPVLIGGAALLVCLYVIVQLLRPLPVGTTNIEIEIPKGSTFRQVVDILAGKNLIRNKTLFLALGRISGIHRKVRAGYYSIYRSMDTLELLRALRNGQIIEYEITVVEGDSLQEIAGKLSEKGIVGSDAFFRLSKDGFFLAAYDIDAPSFEGYLFPDTYKIPKGMSPEDAIGMMINMMREKMSAGLSDRAIGLGLTENEVLTLASIIEKEAVTDDERPIISAVYHNRLKRNIPLQADPTAIYGVKSSKEKITSEDLKKKTPYNTYTIRGLPPGPISSPGIKSITAALYPAYVPYIYFVSNNDGTHQFSVTASEHTAAVRAYREKKQMEKETEKPGETAIDPETHGDR
ncbi:MAG: endolytic transglycosylase MltG [Nitrospirota bacterium]